MKPFNNMKTNDQYQIELLLFENSSWNSQAEYKQMSSSFLKGYKFK